ncbi:MAG TPA: DUF928 domain-containing protein [Acidobacteriaceae bacterium]|nr:DUF928 domain-containing protein [Acidobacteriaceae bacterium]
MTRIIAKKMIVLAAAVGMLTVGSAWAQTSGAAAKPVRVRAKLDGFDLTPKNAAPVRRPNQIGGVSRGLGTLVLYAPTMGKSYTLTPTFSWRSDDPKGEYTLRISQPGMGADAVYEAKVVGDHFTYPADAPALKAGETYVWTVQPTVDMLGGPASASLVIVGGSEREAIDAALAKAQAASDPAAAAAKVYTDMRLWFDAVAAYSNLIERFPARSEFYQARADLYDQLPATSALADADAAKIHK